MWVPSSQMGGCPVAGFSPWGSCSLQPAPESYALGRDPDALHDAIDDLSPQAQCVLLISIANHLREAVDGDESVPWSTPRLRISGPIGIASTSVACFPEAQQQTVEHLGQQKSGLCRGIDASSVKGSLG